MSFSRVLAAVLLTCSPVSLLAMPSAGSGGLSSIPAPGTVEQFTVGPKTEVPGHTLKEGSYKLAVVDHLSDRMVLRVTSDDGKEVATFLGLPPGHSLPGQSGQGPILINAAHGTKALRGFVFPDGSVAEFVYPKKEAVALAKASDSTIPAIDPASDGLSSLSHLSRSDMQLVTLWILTPTTVGPNDKAGIQARRYNETAEASAAPAPAARPATDRTNRMVARDNNPQPYQVASNTPPAQPEPRARANRIAVLPHTASSLPVFILVGLFSMLLACFLTFRRLGEWLELR